MLRNRAMKVTLEKQPKNATPVEPLDTRPIEDKTEAILKKSTKFGARVLAGVCIYVLADTIRQVAVARASQPYPTDD